MTGLSGSPQPPIQSTRAAVLVPFGIVTLIWGSTWLVIRDQIAVVPPSWSISYRFLIAGIAMAIYARVKRESLLLDARGYAFAAIIGTALFAFNFNFVYRAEHYVTSGLVAVVFALLLVPNAVFGRIFLGQKLGRQLMLGCAVAITVPWISARWSNVLPTRFCTCWPTPPATVPMMLPTAPPTAWNAPESGVANTNESGCPETLSGPRAMVQ